MITSAEQSPRLGRATLGSLGVHVLLALSIPALAWTASTAPPIETISFTHVSHIELQPPPQRRPQPRALAPRKSETPQVTVAARHLELSRSSPRIRSSPLPAVEKALSAAPSQAMVSVAGAGQAAAAEAAPAATATPAERDVASTGAHSAGGYLPFGAEQPDPVLDPVVLRELQKLGVHVTVIVTVGEDGHTKSVAFDSPLDADAQARIQSLLADATWDPAVCGGGTSCEGRATIKL